MGAVQPAHGRKIFIAPGIGEAKNPELYPFILK